jgi:hypothetical protein
VNTYQYLPQSHQLPHQYSQQYLYPTHY